jgi:hypothetical protein
MTSARTHNPFGPGAMAVITLANPREKFWGMILGLAPEGLSASGVDLSSFEDLARMVKEGDAFTPSVVFFPMQRIERIEADLPVGDLQSLSQRFFSKTGVKPEEIFAPASGEVSNSSDRLEAIQVVSEPEEKT